MPNDLAIPDRTRFLGGSDVAAVMGLSKWTTPLQLYLKKIGEDREIITPQKQALFDRGHRWEPIALDMLLDALEDKYGKRPALLRRNGRYVDPAHDFLACEIDAETEFDGETVNIELKTVNAFAAREWGEMGEDGQLSDAMPVYYAAQSMHGIGITGRTRCIVGALFGADMMVPYEVVRDDETIAAMKEKCVHFWQENVIARRPPEPVNMDDMMRLFSRVNGKPVELDEGAFDLVNQLRTARANRMAIERDCDAIELQIANYIWKQWYGDSNVVDGSSEDNAILTYGGTPVCTWKKQSRASLDTRALAAAHPDIAQKFQRTSWFRVMRPAKVK